MYPHKSQASNPPQSHNQRHHTAPGRSGDTRNLVTPDPSPLAGLTYKPGDVVRLLATVNRTFITNDIVKIIGHQPAIMSETKRPGQSTEWTMTDGDTVYKFEKRVVAKSTYKARSGDLTEAVTHYQIASTVNGPPDALGRQWGVNSLVYTLQDLPFKVNIDGNEEALRVPKGTLCRILKLTTRKSGEAGGRVYHTVTPNHINKYFYILEAKVEISQWENVTCTIRKDVSNFAALTPLEKRAYNSSILPPKKVIPYDA